MPFAMADRPSIQCGLLKAELARGGHEVDVLYLNLELAAEIGADFYHELAHLRSNQFLGEWLFSAAAFENPSQAAEYFAACPTVERTCAKLGVDLGRLCELRDQVLPEWIRGWAEDRDWSVYTAIGFTCTFQQNTAAFALARALKERFPRLVTIFGGSNFDGGMGRELVRALPFIDYAVVGEGDRALTRMIGLVVRGRTAEDVPGVLARHPDGSVSETPPGDLIHDLDELPDPDYDEYFSSLFRLGRERVLGNRPPLLLFESARGCWWGQKRQCTFCGLNNQGMKFRSKSPDRVVSQLRNLASKYKIVNFEAVDNIMDHSYLEKLCEPLAERHYDFRIFYEVKSNLTAAQLRTMKRAGVRVIQPGIESLSSHVLSLMRKGVTMLRNVRLLKWAAYYGIQVNWNILTGFPGETSEDYAEQLRVLRLLRHLPPPDGCGPIWLERFSPLFFDRSFPVRAIEPLAAYRFIYPEDQIRLREIAYFFDYEMDSTVPREEHAELHEVVDGWREDFRRRPRPELVYQRAPDWIQILDRRTEDLSAHAFEGVDAAVYELCGETDRTAEAIAGRLSGNGFGSIEGKRVETALGEFCSRGLMLEENGRYLSLALPANPHW